MTLGRNERESEAFMHVRPRINAERSLRELLRRMWAEGYIIQAHHIDREMNRDHWDIVYAPWMWNTEKGPRRKDQLVGVITRNIDDGTWHFRFSHRDEREEKNKPYRINFILRKNEMRYNRVVNAAIAVEWWQE